jgi:divalent metal cation (Fe/Co/Zn/Cd) transporter
MGITEIRGAPDMREPDQAELDREASVRTALWIDALYDLVIVSAALTTGSLTMLSEAVRAIIMLALLVYSFMVLRAIHRGRLSRFEFGAHKLECLVTLGLAISFVLSAAWIIGVTVETVFSDRPGASPLGLATAALVNAANLALNGLNYDIVRRRAHGGNSESFRSQLSARRIMFLCSAILQVTLTAAVLASDPLAAVVFDAIGAIFVTGLIIRGAFGMFASSIPVLLDARPDGDVAERLRSALARELPAARVVSLRARRTGEGVHAEIGLTADATVTAACLAGLEDRLAPALGKAGQGLQLTIVPERPASAAMPPGAP